MNPLAGNREAHRRFFPLRKILACLGLCTATAFGHHSTLPYDGDHPTTIRGIVTRFEWRNPHTYIYVDARNADGVIEHWTIESESPNLLSRLGWTKDSMRAGDWITSLGGRAKSGATSMRCKWVEVDKEHKLPCFPND